jgi:hypothetical protein
VFRAVSETNTGRGREVASAAASVTTGAVVDIATPVCVSQTTPALVNERARVLRRPTRSLRTSHDRLG